MGAVKPKRAQKRAPRRSTHADDVAALELLQRAATLPPKTLLFLAHEKLRKSQFDEADVVLAVLDWPNLAEPRRVDLVRAARRARGQASGKSASDRGRRAQFVRDLAARAAMHADLVAFAYVACGMLERNRTIIERGGGKLPTREAVATALRRLAHPRHFSDDAGERRAADTDERVRAVLDACGIDGKSWRESALDRRSRQRKRAALG